MCLGSSLVSTELFLFITAVLQTFKLEMADPENPPSLNGIMGDTLSPQPFTFKVNVRPRAEEKNA